MPGPDPEPRCHIGTWPARRGRRSWPRCGWIPDFSAAARCPKRTVPETNGRGRQQRSGHRRQPRSDRWRQPRSGRGQRRPRITTSGRRPRSGCERRPKGGCGRRRPRSGGRGAWPSSVTEEQWPRSGGRGAVAEKRWPRRKGRVKGRWRRRPLGQRGRQPVVSSKPAVDGVGERRASEPWSERASESAAPKSRKREGHSHWRA